MNTSKKVTPLTDEKVLAVGKQRVNLNNASNKLLADIQFLKDRISRMQDFKNPNKETLNTYEEMLKNREAVLTWLEEQKTPKNSTSATSAGQAQ